MTNAFKDIKPHPASKGKLIIPKTLLSVSADAKTVKGEKSGYLTGILYLAPGTLAGVGNMCVYASKGCAMSCLWKAGRAAMFKAINKSRVIKTRFLYEHREQFISLLLKDVAKLVRKANRLGLTPALRLNGTSDLRFLDSPSSSGQGRLILLKAKGPAKNDKTGFVIRK